MADHDQSEHEDVEFPNEQFQHQDLDGEAPDVAESGASFIDDLSTSDLEDAYLRALEAMESADWAVVNVVEPDADSATKVDGEAESLVPVLESGNSSGVEIAGSDFLGGAPSPLMPANTEAAGVMAGASPEVPSPTSPEYDKYVSSASPHPRPSRIIEACLFVGGQPLSARKLANVLDGNNEAADMEALIDELNLEYAAQARPYEIRLGDGGYRLVLRSEFDAVRNRVYGVGPRDVKLSQDVLEVLALVAYQQPINHAAIEACKPNSANLLRQLLRRELIGLTRLDQTRNGVEYRTTPRFLQLFGLGQLNELPRPEELSMR